MELIPVIDLMAGQVVRAQRGERHNYRPIRSPRVAGSAPLDVARALVEASGATTLYIADLDALMGGTRQIDALAALVAAMPDLHWWVDAGWRSVDEVRAALAPLGAAAQQVRPVFGSETFADMRGLAACFAGAGDARAILSLDRRGDARLGDARAWDDASWWPHEVIVMTLEAVGADGGPALDAVAEVRRRAGMTRRVIGAGGVRHAADLAAGERAGADAWLVASALHDGRLGKPLVR